MPLVIRSLLACLLLVSFCRADCVHDYRSDKKAGIKVTDFKIVGTQALSSTDINRLTGQFTDSCFNEDSEELGERVRALFQDEGYFKVEVKNVAVKAVDPLATPKAVNVEAEVAEGPRFKIAEIQFLKNHAFSSEKLREEFPLKRGDVMARGAVVTGIEGLRKLYGTNGYLEYIAGIDTQPASDGMMNLVVTLESEGPQYRLDKVEIVAQKELAAKLYAQWKLSEGAVYDAGYIDKFIEENRDLLPMGFTHENAQVVRDCPAGLVNVTLMVDASEGKIPAQAKNVPCEEKKEKPQ